MERRVERGVAAELKLAYLSFIYSKNFKCVVSKIDKLLKATRLINIMLDIIMQLILLRCHFPSKVLNYSVIYLKDLNLFTI